MSRYKVLPILLVAGLLALVIPLAIAVAQGGGGTVTIRDSDGTNFSDKLSDQSTIVLTGVPALPADQAYEGWFVSDDASRKESAGILVRDASGNINQTFLLKGADTTSIVEEDSITITLDELNESGQSGTATLTASGDQTVVDIDITAAASTADEPQPIHIHLNSCTDLGGIDVDLTQGGTTGVVGGKLTAVANVTLASLRDGTHVINAHKSTAEIAVYVACGAIPVPTTVTTLGTPTGENLFADFDKFVVTIEPIPDLDSGPSAVVAYIHAIPAGGILHIRHLLFSLGGNPPYSTGFHAGTPKGLAVGLREQTDVALTHARLSLTSTTLADVQAHACHVINIVEGTGDKGGTNFDSSCGNPGDDFGVLNYSADTALHAGLADSAAAADPVIAANSPKVIASADLVTTWATDARDLALLAKGSNDVDAAKLFIGNARDRLVSALDAAKGAYVAAQDMGTYTLAVPAGPVVTDPKPPPTGDPHLPNIALAALLTGAFLLISGAFIYRRSRRYPSTG